VFGPKRPRPKSHGRGARVEVDPVLSLAPFALVPFRVFVFEGTFLLVDRGGAIVIGKCWHVLEDMSMSKLLTRQADGSSRSGPGASTTDAPSRSGRGGLAGSAARLTLSAASALCLKYAVPPYEREPAQAGDGRHVVARCVITEYPKLDLTVWEDGLVALAGLGRG
jgi:hypothetical protein